MVATSQHVQAYEYIVESADQIDDKIKSRIYDIVTNFRFPSILDKEIQAKIKSMYPSLDMEKTFGIKEEEYKFIQSEVHKIASNIKVTAIPKSLWQFIAYDYFASEEFDIDMNELKTFAELEKAMKPITEMRQKFKIEQYAKKGEEYGLTKAYHRFTEDKNVKEIFWKVNEWAEAIWDINDKNITKTMEFLLNQYKDSQRLLDETAKTSQKVISAIYNLNKTRIEVLTGNDEKARQALVQYTTNYILSEDKNPNYTVCRGSLRKPDPDTAIREAICFGDGLGSGYIFDEGANPYLISSPHNKLWILELDRTKLLNDKCPIHIPMTPHLLSALGNGELVHVRTKVVQGVVTKEGVIDKYKLSITAPIVPIIVGYQANQTPEYFTTKTPQIIQEVEGQYIPTGQGEYDADGAKRLQEMLSHVRKVADDGTF